MNRAEAAEIARAAKAARQPSLATRFWSKVDRSDPDGCWPWLAGVRKRAEGYGAFWLGGKHRPAHRIAWELTRGAIGDESLEVCHRCDNPPCCNPAHLFLGTRQDNNEDKVSKQRHIHGERHYRALLTPEIVSEIRSSPRYRGYRMALAEKYGVRPGLITEVRAMKSWKHI